MAKPKASERSGLCDYKSRVRSELAVSEITSEIKINRFATRQ